MSDTANPDNDQIANTESITQDEAQAEQPSTPVEKGGPSGPEPTRYGDWEKAGRCIDF